MRSHRKKSKSKQAKVSTAGRKRAKKAQPAKQSARAGGPKKALKKKRTGKKTATARPTRRARTRSDAFLLEPAKGKLDAVSGRESGDLEGLSRAEEADSESVDELVEEGNSFEAGVVAGVEEADNADEREVHTHEVPEDDVPEEYLDKD
jgi:hypothetical protein